MAVTAIWPIKGRLDQVLAYVRNPEKTTQAALPDMTALHSVQDVVEYTVDEIKTERRSYVTCLGCSEGTAAQQFLQTKKYWNKTGGRVCYHGYQSFREGEVTAEQAHRIGVALARELWGGRFEVVVATHLNTSHYHNHFVINSVSFVDGKKFCNSPEDYRRMRQVSDRLCREARLSVLTNPGGKKMHHAEWSAQENGKPTWRQLVKDDIDRAVAASTTMRDFYRVMEQMGYTLKRYGERGQPLAHPVALPPGARRGVRMDRLGEAYTFEGIAQRILRNMKKRVPFPEAESRPRSRYRCPNYRSRRKAAGLRALYFYYCYRLNIIVKHPASVKRVPDSLREDILKLDQRIAETRLLGKYGIETAQELTRRKQMIENQIQLLTNRRREQRNTFKRLSRMGEAEQAAAVKKSISALSGELKKLRREVILCDSIYERSRLVKEGLDALKEQEISERKEQTQHEPSRRRSGTDRQTHPGWR